MTETTAALIPNHKRVSLSFAIAFAVIAGASLLLFVRIPHTHELINVPQVGTMIALMLPILWWQTIGDRKKATKIATIASCAIWVIGIAASILIKPGSNLIYLGDSLLLAGFFPLLYLWRFSFPWLVFGILNLGIGVLLLVITFSPDNLFPPELLPPKHHLREYHPAISWLVCGAIATIYGMIRLIKNLWKMISGKKKGPAS